MRRAVLAACLVVLLMGCSGSQENAESQPEPATRSRPDPPPPAASEPVSPPRASTPPEEESREPERQAVVDARVAAERAQAESLNPPDPDHAGLRDTHAGAALQRVRHNADLDARNTTVTRYPRNSKHDLVVRSVTFPSDDVAWIETCINDDSQRFIGKQLSAFSEGPRTLRLTEEMRKDDGVWRLTQSFVNRYQEGIKSCPPSQPYREAALDAELRRTITQAREQAEQDWIDWLVDLDKPVPGSYTGLARQFFGDYPETLGFLDSYCPIQVGQARSSEKCLQRFERGSSVPAFAVRSDGVAFDRSSRSQVTVRSIRLQAVEQPKVAYLRTCRVYRVKRRDGGDIAAPSALVESIETMHLEDGSWKLSNRWNFHVQQDVAAGCE